MYKVNVWFVLYLTFPREKRSEADDRKSDESTEAEYLRMCKALSLAIAYSANCGGVASLTGTGPNVIMKGAADMYVLLNRWYQTITNKFYQISDDLSKMIQNQTFKFCFNFTNYLQCFPRKEYDIACHVCLMDAVLLAYLSNYCDICMDLASSSVFTLQVSCKRQINVIKIIFVQVYYSV